MYDLIVVGAGPAGSSAARYAAQQGLKTLVIEKEKVPRNKLCGGGLTPKVLDLLDFKLPDEIVERTVSSARIHVGKECYPFETSRPLSIMVSRAAFDTLLTEKALDAGSEIVDNDPVLKVEANSSEAQISTKNNRYHSKFVIGADGINSPTARSTHLHSCWKSQQVTYAIESEINVGERAVLDFSGLGDYFDLYFGVSPAGYGWIFPKHDHLTVGIGCRLSRLRNARLLFERFTQNIQFLKEFEIPHPRAHLLPLGGMSKVRTVGNRVVLAGDSAGFVEAFLGEGIYFAILSGQLAGTTVVDASRNDTPETLQSYERECWKKFGKDLEVAYRLACFSYLEQYDMGRIVQFFLSERLVQECMIGLMNGTIRYRDARTKLVWPYCKYLLAKAGLPIYSHDEVGN